jgi:hypothetical protein
MKWTLYLHDDLWSFLIEHFSMACSQVADGGGGLQVQTVAMNIVNKQSLAADKGQSSILVVGRRASNPLP